jgi:hypothetical protein
VMAGRRDGQDDSASRVDHSRHAVEGNLRSSARADSVFVHSEEASHFEHNERVQFESKKSQW